MKALMVVGTATKVGKSLITAAICRHLVQMGWRVAPFQAQTLVRHTHLTSSGGEVSHALMVQAWAARVRPTVEMNPIILRPVGQDQVAVLLRGKRVGQTSLNQYFERYAEMGWQAIAESLQELDQKFDLLVCEGGGSPCEITSNQWGLTNMRIARHLGAPTLLIADMARGGAFAHIIGTLNLLTPTEQRLVRGIILNQAWGERSRLQMGLTWLQERTGIAAIRVIPQLQLSPTMEELDLWLDPAADKTQGEIKIVVMRLPHLANLTDFEPLEAESTVSVEYLDFKADLGHPDAIIIPTSRAIIADLAALQASGVIGVIQDYIEAGGTVLGIGGGFHMLGHTIVPPDTVENAGNRYRGLGLLPLRTMISGQRILHQRSVTSSYPQPGLPVVGYETQKVRTQLLNAKAEATTASSYQSLFEDASLGMVDTNLSVWGVALHGIFDNGPWRRTWLNCLRQQRGLKALPTGVGNYQEQREAYLAAIATAMEPHLDLAPLLPKR